MAKIRFDLMLEKEERDFLDRVALKHNMSCGAVFRYYLNFIKTNHEAIDKVVQQLKQTEEEEKQYEE